MKWDLKSIITLILILVLAIITLFLVGSMVFGALGSDNPVVNAIIVLFSNSVTMILTYFFTRKEKKEKENENE